MDRTAVLLLALLAGCGQTPWGLMADRTSDWYETGQVRKSKADIARTVRELILRQGYQTPEFDVEDRLETAWDVRLATRWREGVRSKLEAEILPHESGGFNVRVRCTMEVNENQSQPGIAERAQWVGAGVSEKHKVRIPEPAIKIQTQLKNRFFGLNP
jgi:hypothetical protein